MRRLHAAALTAFLAAALAATALALQNGNSAAQGPVLLGADTNVAGNTATTLGAADGCIEVSSGDTFDMDISVSDVSDLVGWELYLRFDPPIVDVIQADLWQFLASNPRSSLTVQSIPLSGGRHFLGAADMRGAPESGSGVLARVTLEASGAGVSSAEIFSSDFDGDGDMDFGPRLTAAGGIPVGDTTGDGVFDGHIQHAIIAVDDRCEGQTPVVTLPPSQTPQPGGNGSNPGLENPENELLRVFGVEPEQPTEGEQDSAEGVSSNADDSEDEPPPVVLRREATPGPGGSTYPRSSSGGGGFPLWGIGLIAAAVMVTGAGVSVYIAARAGGRNWP